MSEQATRVDMVVVGAGFAGLYMLHRARGLGLDVVGIEAGSGVGGTWYWNRYPGARCDIESIEYSYSFDEELQQEWEWSERYAPQAEILRYLEHVADRFDLRRDIRFDTRVTAASFDEDAGRWLVATDAGTSYDCRFIVMATGCLSSAMTPDIEGRDDFAGATYHTGVWPHEGVDFTGKRVGVIGTGSSGVQSIPIIAEQASELIVFQRTPAYSVPAHNAPLDPDEVADIKAHYPEIRVADRQQQVAFGSRFPRVEMGALDVDEQARHEMYEQGWERGGLPFLATFTDLLVNPESNDTAADFVRDKIRDVVEDAKVAERLAPSTVIGCKRMCVDTGYYATYNRPNVTLVDLTETPIEKITATGIRTTATDHELDCIVFATGFDAMTGSILKVDIRGRGGQRLGDAWSAGPRTYLGLGVNGFPNLFTVTGPGSPSVLTNMVVSIEQHVDWISDCVAYLDEHDHTTIEATLQAQDQWVDFVNVVAGFTLFSACSSWYLGANVPGKTRVFMPLPGFPTYAEKCDQVARDAYEGFALT